jgi:hypothetical protein
VLKRMREGAITLQRKTTELPQSERLTTLEELRVILGNQLRWVESELKKETR